MVTDSKLVKDPVCHMMVDPSLNAITFEGMHFAFCSQQCRERFEANPHLYVGTPGDPSPRQEGEHRSKCRHLHLESPIPKNQCWLLVEQLTALMGVCKVEIHDDELAISYDLFEVSAEQIEQALLETGTKLGHGWGERLQRAFIHYLEETEVASLEVQHKPVSYHTTKPTVPSPGQVALRSKKH